jgi:hypothetical protein
MVADRCAADAAISAEPVEDQMMVENRNSGLTLEGGEIPGLDQTRHRHELATSHAVQMVMMRAAQFEPGASVVEQQPADDAASCQFFGGAEHRRKIGWMTMLDHSSVQLFKSPGMPFAATH